MKNKEDFDFLKTFPPLGHQEHHFKKYPNHPWFKTRDEIDNWIKTDGNLLKENKGEEIRFFIHSDFTVEFEKTVSFVKDIEFLPFQIRKCKNFYYDGENYVKKLSSLIGTAYVCEYFTVKNTNIDSMVGLSGGLKNIVLLNSNIRSFAGMPVMLVKQENMLLDGGKYRSWEGFTNCKNLFFVRSEKITEKDIDFIFETPFVVEKIQISTLDVKYYEKHIKMNLNFIDMFDLKKKQEIANLNINLREVLLDNKEKDKKRKL